MPSNKTPKLRNVSKVIPPYPLNIFPKDFHLCVGKEIVYLLATRGEAQLEGSDWEKMFAKCIGAEWKPSNIGLDDVILGNCAWGAKTIKASGNPHLSKKIRLISGRNSPVYSYGSTISTEADPDELGRGVLNIWNERVYSIRAKHKHTRTVVMIKSGDLSAVTIFEFETIAFDTSAYSWNWNKKNNLEGFDNISDEHKFTWQPHGSQFTIIETVPNNKLCLAIRKPPLISNESVLGAINFDSSWISVVT